MEALTITAIITGLTGLSVAICTHLRHSECCSGCFKLDTHTPVGSPAQTPVVQRRNNIPSTGEVVV